LNWFELGQIDAFFVVLAGWFWVLRSWVAWVGEIEFFLWWDLLGFGGMSLMGNGLGRGVDG
jgi:hypothetical protein